MDSLAAVRILKSAPAGAHSHLMQHIDALRQREWEVCFKHVYRETNLTANGIARMDSSGDAGGHVFHLPPADHNDRLGLQPPPMSSFTSGIT
ncbi:hypothetical protein V6N13_048123 [Hibiscus sabdariffa]